MKSTHSKRNESKHKQLVKQTLRTKPFLDSAKKLYVAGLDGIYIPYSKVILKTLVRTLGYYNIKLHIKLVTRRGIREYYCTFIGD